MFRSRRSSASVVGLLLVRGDILEQVWGEGQRSFPRTESNALGTVIQPAIFIPAPMSSASPLVLPIRFLFVLAHVSHNRLYSVVNVCFQGHRENFKV